jgi:competence protein ComGC
MKTSEWVKAWRGWLGTVALLVVAVLAFVYVPDYLKRASAEQKEREALLKYVRETMPAEHLERMKNAAREKVAKERDARGAEGK